MALLQDQEARIKKTEERKKKYGTTAAQVATGFLFGTIVISGLLVIFVFYAVSPNSGWIRSRSTSYEDRLTNKLIGTIHQGAESILPNQEAIEAIRKKLEKGDFALFTSPEVRSTKTNTTINYDLRIIRSDGFKEPVRLTAADLPAGISASATPEVVTGADEAASVQLTIPGTAEAGNYNFQIVAKAETREKAAGASLAVSNLELKNHELLEVRLMDRGTKWQATIGWDTDVMANAWVEYTAESSFIESGQNYAFTSADQANTVKHGITLYYLEPDTIYHYRIKSVDEHNNIVVGNDRVLITQQSS
jgi:hypothetical protein